MDSSQLHPTPAHRGNPSLQPLSAQRGRREGCRSSATYLDAEKAKRLPGRAGVPPAVRTRAQSNREWEIISGSFTRVWCLDRASSSPPGQFHTGLVPEGPPKIARRFQRRAARSGTHPGGMPENRRDPDTPLIAWPRGRHKRSPGADPPLKPRRCHRPESLWLHAVRRVEGCSWRPLI